MHVVALLIYILLKETGARAAHANFAWSYSFALMTSFIGSLSILINRQINKEKNKKEISYIIVSYTLLGLHVLSGIIYFIRLLQGNNYL